MSEKLGFVSDYMEGAHPAILNKLAETNLEKTPGYGLDPYSDSAKDKIRKACNAPDAEVFFLVGGTQTNMIVITSVLKPYQGVISPETGHIGGHEAGAIECGGHKVLTVPQKYGKLSAADVEKVIRNYNDDANHDHEVMPGMVYISQPTEFGTLYSKAELTAISEVCRKYDLPLYLDGARMAYALASPQNDLSLADYAELCDAFYIGGTKCGALFGEALVIPKKGLIPHFFTIIKQRGALLAKGRMLGIQFDTLFTDDLYLELGKAAVEYGSRIQEALKEAGYPLYLESPTNQVFPILDNASKAKFEEQVDIAFWEKMDEDHTAVRFCTSWATTEEDTEKVIAIIKANPCK